MDITTAKILIAGGTGMVGRAVDRALTARSASSVLTLDSASVDLRDQAATREYFAETRPDLVIHAAARVGGIAANDALRADFIYENLMIAANTIAAAHEFGAKKLIFLGSSCIYPRLAVQPIVEEALLTGPLEPTNEPYAIAKIAGIKLCESYYRQHGANFFSVMPTNLYGPFDNFDLESSHVVPALIRKVHEAKAAGLSEVVIWGTGDPMREFLYVDDLAEAIVKLAAETDAGDIYGLGVSHVNIGYGSDITIAELAATIADIVGFEGNLRFDTSRPDGMPRKLLSSKRINDLGWTAQTPLRIGLEQTYRWFLENAPEARAANNG